MAPGMAYPCRHLISQCYDGSQNYANIHVGRVYSVMILIIAVNFLVFIISQFMFFTIARSTVEHYEDLNAIQLLNIQASQYEALRDYIEYTGRIRHDFKHTIRTLSAYAAQKDYDALCSYITQYNNEIQADSRRYFSVNTAVPMLY